MSLYIGWSLTHQVHTKISLQMSDECICLDKRLCLLEDEFCQSTKEIKKPILPIFKWTERDACLTPVELSTPRARCTELTANMNHSSIPVRPTCASTRWSLHIAFRNLWKGIQFFHQIQGLLSIQSPHLQQTPPPPPSYIPSDLRINCGDYKTKVILLKLSIIIKQ